MIISLIGYMGSGKSSIGRRLADMLAWPLIDLDDYIVHREGQEITEIFEQFGEDYFRKKETEYLAEVVDLHDNIIFALGGGTPCYAQNWQWIAKTTSIYLNKSPKALYKNLKKKKAKRPLIQKMSDQTLKKYIISKLSERHPHYARANYIIDTHRPKKKVATAIIRLLHLDAVQSIDDPPVSRRPVLSTDQKLDAINIWNSVYPAQISHPDIPSLDGYLSNNKIDMHYLILHKKVVIAWSFVMIRDGERWFGMLINDRYQGQGLGTRLMTAMKTDHGSLNGWAVDHDRYKRNDGQPYASPVGFYEKCGFTIDRDQRYNTDRIDAARIMWQRS